MTKYRLKKDLPTFKAGDVFTLIKSGLYKDIGERIPILAYATPTLDKFPHILTDWFEEIPERPKTVWDLEEGDICWVKRATKSSFYATSLRAEQEVWENDEYQKSLREYGGIFLTEEDCNRDMERSRAETILRRDAKGFKPDWGSDKYDKFEVAYEYSSASFNGYGLFVNKCNHCCAHTGPWFRTRADAEASIKAHEKEWKIYLGVEEQ